MKKQIKYGLLDQFRKREFIRTGITPQEGVTIELELPTAEVRQAWADLFGLTEFVQVFGQHHALKHLGDTSQSFPANGFFADHYLTESEINKLLLKWQADNAALVAKTQAETEAKAEAKRQFEADMATIDDLLAHLMKSGQYQQVLDLWPTIPESPAKEQAAYKYKKRASSALFEVSQYHFDADKVVWVNQYGSPELQRRVNAGYDATREYVTHRVAKELSGEWVIDWKDRCKFQDRPYPSDHALDIADSVTSKKLVIDKVEVVWLTKDADGKSAHPRHEAVWVKEYLGKYDLYLPILEVEDEEDNELDEE